MKPLFLASLLLSFSAFAQAVAPMAPPRPPAVRTPGVEPHFPAPGATPAGAGLTTIGPPGREVSAPRSPNTRVLPTTAEPGVWASDGAGKPDRGVVQPELLGVPLPVGPGGPDVRAKTNRCAGDMAAALQRLYALEKALALPEAVRRCLAAQLFRACADSYSLAIAASLSAGELPHDENPHVYVSMGRAAKTFSELQCKDVRLTREQDDLVDRARRIAWAGPPPAKN